MNLSDASGFDGVAVPFTVGGDAASVVNAFRELPVSGWHVHGSDLQHDVLTAVDSLTPSAARQNKLNAIVRETDGALRGHWLESPRDQYELWTSS